ncbi:MAG: sigma-70 family RNA polymerase sigma factor [Pseudomonadota bacterium]
MRNQATSDLIVRVAAGDRLAFGRLYHSTSGLLLGVLVRMLGNRQEAEDALQEVYVRVWLRAASFNPDRGQGKTWLVSIARYHAIDQRRLSPPPAMADIEMDSLPALGPGIEQRLTARADARQIMACLRRLDPAHAAALQAAYLNGDSYADLSRRHDVPLNTMRTWLRRSLQKLRRCMEQDAG